jgi:enediyne polyketide synthase
VPQEGASDTFPPIQIDPNRQLYGQQFFHKGPFQRLEGYRQLTAKECVAELAPNRNEPWFGPYLPDSLVLAEPRGRDVAIHAIQVCVPHKLLLPSGVRHPRHPINRA